MTQVTQNIPLEKITLHRSFAADGENDRKSFEGIVELAESIRENGLISPVTVRPVGEGFELVAGERRFRAHLYLEAETIPAIVRDLTDRQAADLMLVENMARDDLDPMSEARAYAWRMERFGISPNELAQIVGKSPNHIRSRVRLLNLESDVQKLLAQEQISLGVGDIMARAGLDANRQRMVIRWMNRQAGTPTLKTVGEYVGKLQQEQRSESFLDLSLFSGKVEAAVEENGGDMGHILPRLPELPDLPCKKGNMADLFDAYVAQLLETGHNEAARVLLDFWAKLQAVNMARKHALDSKTLKVEEFGQLL